ncbi:two-component regulator propeller domain-containing protein [Marinimicrobium locisalis]|uniref:two-component regulator propeller domain-containing protein n=1 Tax=Marinimicrobium locisalis TaxID=546022 RepID=UPI0032215984
MSPNNNNHSVRMLISPLLISLCFAITGVAGASDTSPPPDIRFDNPFAQTDSLSRQMGGVNDLIQGPLGFIWMGAENGVGRYDGRTLKLYQADNQVAGSLPASYVREIVMDREGVLWFATEGGLAYYRQDIDEFVHVESLGETGIAVETVSSLAVGEDNTLYVGTAKGLYIVAPDRASMTVQFPRPPIPPEPNSEQIRALTLDEHGRVWLGTAGMGAAIYDPATQSFDYLLHQPENPNSLRHNSVASIMHDNQGRTWLGTYGGGISRLDRATGQFKHFYAKPDVPGSLGSDVVWDITQDSEGTIWAALDQGGLARFNEQRQNFHHYRHTAYDPSSVASNQLRVVFEDQNQDLWVGAFPSGVSFYNRSTQVFHHYTSNPANPQSLSHDAILSFEEAKDGTIWVGTEGGLNALDPESGTFQRYLSDPTDPHALKSDPVLAIEEDRDGRLWVGTWAGGLHRLDPETGRFERYEAAPDNANRPNSAFVWDILRDRQDRIWIATETGGLNRYHRDTGRFSHYVHDPETESSISGNFVSALIQDQSGQIWLGTFTGLDRLDPATETFTHFPYGTGEPGATSSKSVRSLYEDSQGNIWAGTQHRGVNIYDPQSETFSYLDIRDGLPSSTISSILEDDLGNMWLATTNGLARLDEEGNITTFGREDGLVGSHFNRDASLKDRRGKLYFGSSEGITAFYPQDLDSFTTDFDVRITDFRLLNQTVPIGTKNSPLERSILLTEAITLNHDDTMFSFDFAALNYRQSSAMSYSYRLEGFDRGWNNIGHGSTATYTNISPGEYRFRIRASVNGKDWTEGQSLAITIQPPPWRTWWAYLLYAALFAVLAWFAHKYISLRIRAEAYRNKSMKDPLTQLYNRAGLAQVSEGIFANPTTKEGMCLMLLDIDHFKRVNDRRGHDAGDRILCDVARVVRECLRTSDHFGRWGGEEFVLMCATHDSANSQLLAEKVRKAVESGVYEPQSNPPLTITVSLGVADIHPDDSFESALKRADNALYKAKALGRNCVVMAD